MQLFNEPFLREGAGRRDHVCLFLHGLGGGTYEFHLLEKHVRDLGYSTCGILYPGHEHSERKMPASTWEEWYAHAESTISKLSKEFRSVSLIGFSTGCLLALKLALEFPLHSMSLLAPYFKVRRRWFYLLPPEAYIYSVGYLFPDLPRAPVSVRDPEMRKAVGEVGLYETFNLPCVRSTIQLIRQLKRDLHKIETPAMIMQSKSDSVVHPSGAQHLYDGLAASRKELHWLDTSDHIIPLDEEREVVFQAIENFLCDPESCDSR